METLVRKTNAVNLHRQHTTIQAINENPSITDFKFWATNKWVNWAQNQSKIQLPQGTRDS